MNNKEYTEPPIRTCLIHSLKSNICSTDCIYHAKMCNADIAIISKTKSLSTLKSFKETNQSSESDENETIMKLRGLQNLKSVGPFITTYTGRFPTENFISEKYFNFNHNERHKGTNKVFTNLNQTDAIIEVISKPVCDFSLKQIELGTIENNNNLELQENFLSIGENHKISITLRHKEFLILPIENYFFKIHSDSQLHVLHGYYVMGSK